MISLEFEHDVNRSLYDFTRIQYHVECGFGCDTERGFYISECGLYTILNVGIYTTTNVGINMTTDVGIHMTTDVGINMTTDVGMNMATNVGMNMTPNVLLMTPEGVAEFCECLVFPAVRVFFSPISGYPRIFKHIVFLIFFHFFDFWDIGDIFDIVDIWYI